MKHITAQQKHDILIHVRDRRGNEQPEEIAARHGVAAGRSTVYSWLQQWDGTPRSLERKAGSGKQRTLSAAEVQRHVRAPILAANRAARAVRYSSLLASVRQKTGKQVSIQTLRRYGHKELGAKQKRGKKRTADERECAHTLHVAALSLCCVLYLTACVCLPVVCPPVSADMCEQIAQVRRKLQRIGTQHILFLDETHKRDGDVQNYTIVLEGEPPYIESSNTSSYAPRYDMIACCSGTTTLPPVIYDSSERGRGVTQEMLLQHIRNLLAQAAGALDVYPLLLVVDRSGIHQPDNMLRELHDWGCQEMKEVLLLPPASAKRLSPLDNSLFNLWRTRVLADGGLTKHNIRRRMSDAWNSITAEDIRAQYRNCGLMRHQDVYFDCPNPTAHKHRN